MQAITTKYIAASNYRGSRIVAQAEAGKVYLSWEHGLNQDNNHLAAAVALAKKFGWKGQIVGGHLPRTNSSHMAWVFVNEFSPTATIVGK